jgi:hypothetical protein
MARVVACRRTLLLFYFASGANFRRAASFLPFGRSAWLKEEDNVMWTIFAILLVLWLLGWGFHIAGALIHLLLVVALLMVAVSLLSGRRTV